MRLSEAEARRLGIPFEPAKKRRNRKCKPGGGQDQQSKKTLKGSQPKSEVLFDKLCVSHGLPVPVHEYEHWHPTRKWRFDYLFEGWLAVERIGGIWAAGHHSGGRNQMGDMERRNEAQILGYTVLEFTPEQFDTGEAFAVIKRALEAQP